MKHNAFWVFLISFTSSTTLFADSGVDAYRQGDFKKAAAELMAKSKLDAVESYYLGRMNLYGYGQLKNNAKAIKYFEQAAESGYLPAQQFLGRYELLVKNDPTKALHWFKKAAMQGDMKAQMYSASAYLFGVGVKKNEDVARKYYIEAAKKGNLVAEYTLGANFLASRHSSNQKLGLIWMKRAADKGLPQAQLALAEVYAQGKLVGKDIAQSTNLINSAAASNYLPAIIEEGLVAENQDEILKAKDWYLKAADMNDSDAQLALSKLYFKEKSPIYDPKEGFLWALKAAQNNSQQAQQFLASLYKEGKGTDISEDLAKEWLEKSKKSQENNNATELAAKWISNGQASTFANGGYQLKGILSTWQDPDANQENVYNQAPQMIEITRDMIYQPKFKMASPNSITIPEYFDALMRVSKVTDTSEVVFNQYPYSERVLGLVKVADDKAEVAKIIESISNMAAIGNSRAQFDLGQIEQYGIGVDKDPAAAIKDFKRAAMQKDLRAMYSLGVMYLEGQGVSADYKEGVKWLQEAAFNGSTYAEYALAKIYELGYEDSASKQVIKADNELARSMYYLASSNSFGPAQYRLAEILVHEPMKDISVAAKNSRNNLIKNLYNRALEGGVQQAALPVAFFNAMSDDPSMQSDAFKQAEKEAQNGNEQAALLLGLMYDRGISVAKNNQDAINWYQKAGKNPVTSFILGTYYNSGQGVSVDKEKSQELLQDAADADFSYANLNLAVMKEARKEDFVTDLSKALSQGNSKAGLLLADYYLSLAADNAQMQQARDIYKLFAEKGDKDGQLKLAYMYEKGLGGSVDLARANDWYNLAAEQGQPVAQYLLGRFNQRGYADGKPDYAQAKKWFKASQNDYVPAAVALGYVNEIVNDDYKRAQDAYQNAAQTKNPVSLYNLGLINELGKGQPVNYETARKYYQQAVEQGHLQAKSQLARLYFNGLGGDLDAQGAINLYNQAALEGDSDAAYRLGLLSETGVATELNLAEALKYYQQAADNGNEKAMMALARMHQYGLGTPRDNQQAVAFYSRLANNGNVFAQYQLGNLYYDGMDGKNMSKKGKDMLLLAQKNGSQQAKKMLHWLDAQAQEQVSFVEPVVITEIVSANDKPVELMYMDALSEWNRGDELTSRTIFDQIMTQFPNYIPAKRAYEQLNSQGLFNKGIIKHG